jgi:hypothetical protein
MEKFKKYVSIKENKELEKKKVEILNEKEFINLVGGYENYKLMKEYKLINEDFGLDDATKFFGNLFSKTGSMGSTLLKRITIETIASFIGPFIQKLGVDKNGLLYYMLTYGTQYAINELGFDILKAESKPKFCRAFSVGCMGAIEEWATYNGFANLLNIFGMRKDGYIARIITTTLRDEILKSDGLKGGIERFICETKFDINGKNSTLWDFVTGFISNNTAGLVGR